MAQVVFLPARRSNSADRALTRERAYATVLNLTGPGDDVVTEEGPLTPSVAFAHRLVEDGLFAIGLGVCAFIVGLCVWGLCWLWVQAGSMVG